MDNENDDILFPLEDAPGDVWARLKWAVARATAETTGYYAHDVKELPNGTALGFTVYHYDSDGVTEKWFAIEKIVAEAMTNEKLTQYVKDTFPMAHWDYHDGKTHAVKGDTP